jgi:WD40 repeat protein
MNKCFTVLMAALVLGEIGVTVRAGEDPFTGSSSPALRVSQGPTSGKYWIRVFSAGPKPVMIQLNPDGWPYQFGPTGRSLYGTVRENCLYKLQLESNRGATVACPAGVYFSVWSGDVALSAREDKALIFGAEREGQNRKCGVFEIPLPNGAPKLVTGADCNERPDRRSFSCAPECAFATIIQHSELRILDVSSGTFRSLGVGFLAAAWSPDGKWIAALEGGRRPVTVLFDGATYERRKVLPESEAQWSLDSRYLLRIVGCRGGEDGTAEVLSIDTGKARPIPSSRCQIYNTGTGWVDNSIIPQAGNGPAPP